MASNVLPLFWHLASSSRDKRLEASADLVAAAQSFQSSYSAPAKASGDEDEDDEEDDEEDDGDESGMEVDGDDEDGEGTAVDPVVAAKLDAKLARENAPDVVYCIKRLVRGLGSSREHSRLGFAVALTELLARSPNVTAAQAMSLLLRASYWSKGMKGSDERDMMFARLFGVTAIVDSGLLFSPSSTLDDFVSVLDSLLALADSKAWLSEAAGWGLLRAAEGLVSSSVSWKDDALSALTERVYADRAWSPEKIALTLALQRGAPDLDWKALLSPTFKTTPLLASANLVTLGRVLKEGGDDDSAARAGTYQPKLHYVWDGILNEHFTHSAGGIAPFAELWRTVVDEALFANTSSAERKYWGFQVFERALPLLPSEAVPLVFTPNFMRSWMNNLSSADRHLHKAALQAARKVNEHVKADPTAGFTLLSQLVGKHGRPDFDRVTKTKTVEGIMASLTLDGVDKYVDFLESALVGSDEGADERRTWALDQMLALCRNGAVPKGDGWVGRVLDSMLVHGFFLVRKADKKAIIAALRAVPKPALSELVAATARARFLSAIVEITAHKENDKSDGKGKLWLSRALDTLAALEKNPNVEVVTDADDEIKAIRTGALSVLATLGDRDEPAARGAEILVSFLVLQTYDEAEDALDMLDEAVTAVRGLFPEKKKKRKSKSTEEDADAPPPIDALLDVLIALLDKSSADLRTLANLVFGMLVPVMTESSVEHLVAQLEQSGATAEAEDDVEEEEEEEHEHGPDCDHSDEEDEDEDEDDDSDAASAASDETDADAAVDPEFRRRVAEALKVSGVLDEKEEDDSDDESVWDDEQMMKVDEQLAAVFKQQARGDKKSDLQHAAIESLHFKNRVLDFFDVFLRRPSALALALLLPLLHVVRGGGELGNKAAGILRTRLKNTSLSPSSSASELALAEKVLSEIHALARRAPTGEFSSLCSGASLFAARLAPDAALAAYKETTGDFVTRKHSSVHASFVGEYVKRHGARAWPLAGEILALCEGGKAANAYRHTQAYGLLSQLLTQAPALVKAGDVAKADAEDIVRRAIGDVYAVMEAAAAEDGEWKADRLKDAAKFALVVARAARAVSGSEAAALCDAPRLAAVAEAVKAGRTREMKGVHALLAQLGAVLSKDAEGRGKAAKKGKGEKGVKGVKKGGDDEHDTPKPAVGVKRKADGEVKAKETKAKDKAGKKAKKAKAE